MKVFTACTVVLVACLPLGAAAQAADAVPPNPAPALRAGSVYELTTTDHHHHPTGRVQLRTIALRCTGAVTHATLQQDVFDADNHALATAELPAHFPSTGPMLLDARAFVNGALLAALHLADLIVTEDSLAALPGIGARAGHVLAPAYFTAVSRPGAPLRSVRLALVGRCLGAPETLTTPAGTFECQRLTQQLEIERFDAGVQRRCALRMVCWVTGAGLVRAETYAGDALFDTTLLTRIRPADSVTVFPEVIAVER